MSEPFLGEIRLFAGDFAPMDWAFCDGALLPIAEHEALFSLIGHTWGGDGVGDFALPDLRGRVPIGHGVGPGLTPRPLGQKGGAEAVALTSATLAAHSHAFNATSKPAASMEPKDKLLAVPTPNGAVTGLYLNENTPAATIQAIDPNMLDFAGGGGRDRPGGAAHVNTMPSLALNYIIALMGSYPSPPR